MASEGLGFKSLPVTHRCGTFESPFLGFLVLRHLLNENCNIPLRVQSGAHVQQLPCNPVPVAGVHTRGLAGYVAHCCHVSATLHHNQERHSDVANRQSLEKPFVGSSSPATMDLFSWPCLCQ